MKTVQALIQDVEHTELKVIAAKEGTTLQALVGAIINKWLSARKEENNVPEENDEEN